jgi:4-diphosphocytidyl-2-C-methyl-D-erythritol kinase
VRGAHGAERLAGAAGGRLTVVLAPAKLTVSLRVTGRRADGYHLLDAEMVSLDLADELTFGPGWGLEVVAGHHLGYVNPHDNLVGRALEAVGREARVSLVKRIPAGGGLGGGSSNAAAVMRWAGCDDLAVAESLGADVPFCLHGGRARVQGIGEILSPLPFVPRTITLAVPRYGCSTPAVYAAWDALGGPTADGPNDLEPAALVVQPRMAAFRDAFGSATGQTPVLAGSGSTWFVDGAHPGEGRIVAHTIPAY